MTGADTLDEARKGGPPGIVLSSNGLGVSAPERDLCDAPICHWCDNKGLGTCQHYDDTKTCVWRSLRKPNS